MERGEGRWPGFMRTPRRAKPASAENEADGAASKPLPDDIGEPSQVISGYRRPPPSSDGTERLLQDGFEKATGFGLRRSQLCLQPVAEDHQFVNLGDDAVLLGERREGNRHAPEVTDIDALERDTLRLSGHPRLTRRRINTESDELSVDSSADWEAEEVLRDVAPAEAGRDERGLADRSVL
jgi:hypothetical protein